MNPHVDQYLEIGCGRCSLGGTPQCKVHFWPQELNFLRLLILDCGLTEEVKWGVPCYTANGKNILILSAFKNYCSINFFKGSLLSDEYKLLSKPGESTQAGRVMKFIGLEQIVELESTIKAYIFEAIEVEKAGLKVEVKNELDPLPEELVEAFKNDKILEAAFYNLTPGRQRGYVLFFNQAKQSKTRIARIQKSRPDILIGKGMGEYPQASNLQNGTKKSK
jgi:uncharacterized protein YdeI (YjbR/CyaY-like superfamily)